MARITEGTPRGSVIHLFGQLVPADAVADVRPQLPLDALRRRLSQLEQVRGLRDRVERRIGRQQLWGLGGQRGELLQAAGDWPPPPPVRPAPPSDGAPF